MPDTLLLFRESNPKFETLLGKLGYTVLVVNGESSFNQIVAGSVVDAVILDIPSDPENAADRVELCRFLKSQEHTNAAPIFIIGPSQSEQEAITHEKYSDVELIEGTPSIGQIAGKVATTLRVRKLEAADNPRATLAAANAALRDLNERFVREIAEARRIQEALLPGNQLVSDKFQLESSYSPLDTVGGDWFYFKIEPSAALTVQIADVTGHGLAAAFIGSMTKLALTAADVEDPGERLREMNRLMTPQMPEGRFVTITSILFDPATGQCKVACAGHPAPIMADFSTGEAREIGSLGFGIGFVDDHEYEVATVEVPIGGVMVLYTDGIVEAKDRNNELYGLERLKQSILAAGSTASAAEIIAKIKSSCEQFLDGRIIKDDITIVALKRVG